MEWKKFIGTVYDAEINIERISAKKRKLDSLRPLSSAGLERLREDFFIEWTYNTNGIEGNTLSLNETRMVLLDGLTIKGKSLKEHFETVNHKNAIDFLETLIQPNYSISEKDIMSTHQLVLQNIERDFAGRFRNSGVRITGANFLPPNALRVPDMLAQLIEFINENFCSLHPVFLTTIFHHRFVWIHPFFDGNGRTARLIFNLILMKLGYPPAIILKADRKKYYDALNKANTGDYAKLTLLMGQAIERSLDIYISNFDNYAPELDDLQNIVKEPEVQYSQEYVSLLARRGKIAAHKENGKWVTSTHAVQEYISTRKRKRKLK